MIVSMDDPRVQEGVDIIQSMWYGIAIQIVNMAIHTYKCDAQQAKALKELFLKPNDYTIRLRLR